MNIHPNHQHVHDHLDAAEALIGTTTLMRRLRLHKAASHAAVQAVVHLTIAAGLMAIENAELRQRLKAAGHPVTDCSDDDADEPETPQQEPVNLDDFAADLAANLGKTARKETPK